MKSRWLRTCATSGGHTSSRGLGSRLNWKPGLGVQSSARNAVREDHPALAIRSYVSKPDRGRRNWRGKHVARDAVYANRRRIRGARGNRLLRRRGERLERPKAHLYATGGMRRVHLRGHGNILKRLLLQVCGLNLGLLMRQLLRVGAPAPSSTPCGSHCAASGASYRAPRRAGREIGPSHRGFAR